MPLPSGIYAISVDVRRVLNINAPNGPPPHCTKAFKTSDGQSTTDVR
jgi:hypothetical protein